MSVMSAPVTSPAGVLLSRPAVGATPACLHLAAGVVLCGPAVSAALASAVNKQHQHARLPAPPCRRMLLKCTVSTHFPCTLLQEWCFVGLPSQPPRPSLSEDKYIAFVSGLEVGNDAADPLRLSLVVDYLTGLLGSGEEQKLIAKVGAGSEHDREFTYHSWHCSIACCWISTALLQTVKMAVVGSARCYVISCLPRQAQVVLSSSRPGSILGLSVCFAQSVLLNAARGRLTERSLAACRLPGWSLQAACCRAPKACPRPPRTASRSSRRQPSRPSSELGRACSYLPGLCGLPHLRAVSCRKRCFYRFCEAPCHALSCTITCPAPSEHSHGLQVLDYAS